MKCQFHHRQLDYACTLIREYNYETPFHLYLKSYFSRNRKHGSRDRKNISELCYGYFRLGNGVIHSDKIENDLLLAYYLFQDGDPGLLLKNAQWHETISGTPEEKLLIANEIFEPDKIFPFPAKLSREIPLPEWNRSMMQQPRTFIRIRPGKREKVMRELQKAHIPFTVPEDDVLSFHPGIDLSRIVNMDTDAVIQDFNSGKAFTLLSDHKINAQNMWDCCAGSGGKSLLFHDLYPQAAITVSDTRKQILHNLKTRFRKAGISKYESSVMDLTQPVPSQAQYDLIIADAPCSGSGTWARTPEWLRGITEARLNQYPSLQTKIVCHALPSLKKNGYLLYITCSVYAAENEAMTERIQEDEGLVLIEDRYLSGYDKHADTLYTALFQSRDVAEAT